MEAYLPDSFSEGWLPIYILLVGVTAVGNALQCYSNIEYVKRIYAGHPPKPALKSSIIKTVSMTVETSSKASTDKNSSSTANASASSSAEDYSPATPLSSRTMGTWNLAVGIARIYAAYHIHEESWYQMQMWTNIVGIIHFGLEGFVYKTAPPAGPWLAPVLVATIGLGWSIAQYSYYVL